MAKSWSVAILKEFVGNGWLNQDPSILINNPSRRVLGSTGENDISMNEKMKDENSHRMVRNRNIPSLDDVETQRFLGLRAGQACPSLASCLPT